MSEEQQVQVKSAAQIAADANAEKQKEEARYGRRVSKMTDRQLQSEIKKQRKANPGTRLRNEMIGTILEAVFENHLKGMTPYVR